MIQCLAGSEFSPRLVGASFSVFDPEDQHLRAVAERDDLRAVNKDYAEELRAVRAEHCACLRQLACLRAEHLQLRAEVDFLRPTSSNPYRMGDFFFTKLPVGHAFTL